MIKVGRSQLSNAPLEFTMVTDAEGTAKVVTRGDIFEVTLLVEPKTAAFPECRNGFRILDPIANARYRAANLNRLQRLAAA